MDNETIHVLKDESLGGIEREFIIGSEEIVTTGERVPRKIATLVPTDIVHIDGAKYRMVNREAEVGEKVIIVSAQHTFGDYDNGCVFRVEKTESDYIIVENYGEIPDEVCTTINESEYRVLEPVHTFDNCERTLGEIACTNRKGGSYCSVKCADEDDEPITVDEELVGVDSSQASPEVLDILANLARRVTSLETENERLKRIADTEMSARSTNTKRWLDVKDEIDTLYRNVERIAQEIETSKQVVINTSNVTVNDEADIRKIARQLTELIERMVRDYD